MADNNEGSNNGDSANPGAEEKFRVQTRPRVQEPRMYRVLILNDHYTTMDFVVEVLVGIFNKSASEATKLMLDVHKKGAGMCGVYTYDVASSKIDKVHTLARERQFPLKCSCEPEG